MKDEAIVSFYKEVCQKLEGDYKIILEPGRSLSGDWIEYDSVKWELEKPLKEVVDSLLKDSTLDFEDKLLTVYKYICLNYVYDDNVLFFFKKDNSDPENVKYIAVDWYGRIVDKTWIVNRQKHNRRVCYEFARFYATAINMLLEGNDKLEAFMLGDKENLHYVVGLTGDDYSAVLDLDDFNSIKDLTRLKLGLTLKGIRILRDDSGRLQAAIDKFNLGRLEELPEVEKAKKEFRGIDNIKYFEKVIDILKSHGIDSQGFFEYMKAIVEAEEIETERAWKEINGDGEKRYMRSFTFNFDAKDYLLDSIEKKLSVISVNDANSKAFIRESDKIDYPYYGG